MRELNIVFESPKKWHKWLIKIYLMCGCKVWVVEPFHAYHHNSGVTFYPSELSPNILHMISKGMIKLISAEDLNVRNINFEAGDMAVDSVESAYKIYRTDYSPFINYLCKTLKNPATEHVFKKQLCEFLAIFYSVNILLRRISQIIPEERIVYYADINFFIYKKIENILSRSKQKYYLNDGMIPAFTMRCCGLLDYLKKRLFSFVKLIIYWLVSILNPLRNRRQVVKKNYTYGITIINPRREIVGTVKRPGFIVDNKKINCDQVVYFPYRKLDKAYKAAVVRDNEGVIYPLSMRYQFSAPSTWARLIIVSVWQILLKGVGLDLIGYTHGTLVEYYRWKNILAELDITHFITYCDFSYYHIPRNIALNEKGITTWYFTDSANVRMNYSDGSWHKKHHSPRWCYMYYDHFVTWTEALADYFMSHPESFKKCHVVGCLWADGLVSQAPKLQMESKTSKLTNMMVAVFDSTYTKNSTTSYEEGIAFANDIRRLAEENPNISFSIKEKKERGDHLMLDSVLGSRLLSAYNTLSTFDNVHMYRDNFNSSELLRIADLTISFPFTSTTLEALSMNKQAVWHDPAGYYRNTPYAKTGLTTHNYDDLKLKVLEIAAIKSEINHYSMPMDSPLVDQFRDGKAIERFRDLLTQHDKELHLQCRR